MGIVGPGKTFEALAVIKYAEQHSDRVLVLAPKRLRDNWTLYKANDKRNLLAVDRFNNDVLNHTDLSRDKGTSGDIDLLHVNWGSYDLVVIDESHNIRYKKSPHQGTETLTPKRSPLTTGQSSPRKRWTTGRIAGGSNSTTPAPESPRIVA